jgi:hypothetical protein
VNMEKMKKVLVWVATAVSAFGYMMVTLVMGCLLLFVAVPFGLTMLFVLLSKIAEQQDLKKGWQEFRKEFP